MLTTISTFMTTICTDKPAPSSASDTHSHCHPPLLTDKLHAVARPLSAQLVLFPLPRSLQDHLFHNPPLSLPKPTPMFTLTSSSATLLSPRPPCCATSEHSSCHLVPVHSSQSLFNNCIAATTFANKVTTMTTVKNIQISNNRISFSEKLRMLYGDQTWARSSVS